MALDKDHFDLGLLEWLQDCIAWSYIACIVLALVAAYPLFFVFTTRYENDYHENDYMRTQHLGFNNFDHMQRPDGALRLQWGFLGLLVDGFWVLTWKT